MKPSRISTMNQLRTQKIQEKTQEIELFKKRIAEAKKAKMDNGVVEASQIFVKRSSQHFVKVTGKAARKHSIINLFLFESSP
ncbi:unnamed protein product [Caenorhabditis brenneri]